MALAYINKEIPIDTEEVMDAFAKYNHRIDFGASGPGPSTSSILCLSESLEL